MSGGYVVEKEVRLKLNPKTHAALRNKAKKEMRSISKQVALYIKQALEEEKEPAHGR